MKNVKIFAALFCGSAIFASCEQTDLELPIPFTQVIQENVVIPAGQSTGGSKIDTTFFKAADSPDFEKNLDKVSTLVVEKLSYEISNVTNEDSSAFVRASGSIAIYSADFATSYGSVPMEEASLQDLILSSPMELADAANYLVGDVGNKLLEKLKAGEEIAFISTYTGSNQTNQEYSFDVKAKVKFKATAKLKE